MNRQQQAGKKLTRSEMKNVQGGKAAPPECFQTSDCPGACNPSLESGFICLTGKCRLVVFCP